MKGHVGAAGVPRRREQCPGRGKCESRHPRGRGNVKEEVVSVGEDCVRMKEHIGELVQERVVARGERAEPSLRGSAQGGQWVGVNAC